MPEFIAVTVTVPSEHVATIQEMAARLVRGGASADEALPTAAPQRKPLAPDADLARRAYEESEPRHRAMLEHLAARPGEEVWSSELTAALGLGSKQFAGLNGAFGRRANHRYGGWKPWDFTYDRSRGEGRFVMSEDVAAAIREAAGA